MRLRGSPHFGIPLVDFAAPEKGNSKAVSERRRQEPNYRSHHPCTSQVTRTVLPRSKSDSEATAIHTASRQK